MLHLVADIGNFRIKGGFFKDGDLTETFTIASQALSKMSLRSVFAGKKWDSAMIASVNEKAEKEVRELLEAQEKPVYFLHPKNLTIVLDVDEPSAVGADRIANCYGAWARFPKADALIIDIGTAITFDYTTKDKKYLGGAIAPGMDIGIKALHEYTNRLPMVPTEKPSSPLARTTASHIQAGVYYGVLGAIERLTKEIKTAAPKSKELHVIATGSGVAIDDPSSSAAKVSFVDDLKGLVDFIDPHLTLLGLHEILKKEHHK